MPTYDYHCTHCGYKFEESQSITAQPLKECPMCHKETLKRGPGGGIGLSFKGSGFYITDYPKDGGTGGGSAPKSNETHKNDSDAPKNESSGGGGGCGCGVSGCTK